MKRTTFPFLLIFSLFITFFSCSNTPKRSRKPVSTITIQPNKRNYVFGEKVSVNVKTKLKNGEIKNIKVYYKNQLLKESKELDFTVDGIEIQSLGINNFRVDAVKMDALNNTRTKSISAVSNVVPKKLTYKIIEKYPHSKTYYTEGLEFYNGFIYEGTGENGSSGIFKINLASGNADQSHLMKEKYFGEGITILNDKIYQLTYRSKKGFIYNLKNFVVIDSFQYKSAEGWGLTNDGTNLIMSDGTQFLTWLNPNDLSVIKKIEVANNKGIVTNLNELEYINGSIYANIYTTETIVQIEPETGKIISEVNMAGIINMYHNQKDRIDVMNGIAYDQNSNKIFVTGKLWPKLFEVEFIEKK
ncbi:MAG: glutaminyl-peptide cyclotransferase [Bacteroidetes bacterium]|nr:glutaminyl-peptide cyclotransferase [Bacteroidota bacterium]